MQWSSGLCTNVSCETRQVPLFQRVEVELKYPIPAPQYPIPAKRFKSQSLAALISQRGDDEEEDRRRCSAATLCMSLPGRRSRMRLAPAASSGRRRARDVAASRGACRLTTDTDTCASIGLTLTGCAGPVTTR
jgi:hypothetical protein